MALSCSALATTYYVDFAGGADTNNGTATGTPFKHAPGMLGCASNCNITPVCGDNFYLKGNVTWPNASLGWLLSWNTSSQAGCSSVNTIYLGVLNTYFAAVTGTANTDATGKIVTWQTGVHTLGDFSSTWVGQTVTVNSNPCLVNSVTAATWNTNGTMATKPTMNCNASVGTNLTGTAFSASIWGRPILDPGGTTVGSQAGLANVIIRPYGNYLTIDNFEFKGFFWTGNPAAATSVILEFAGGTPGQGTHNEIKNLLIHGWSHDPNTSPTWTQDTNLVLGDSGVPNNNVGSSFHDNFVTGEDVDRTSGTSGACIFGGPPILYNNWCEYVDQGFVGNGINTYNNNVVSHIGPTFQQCDPTGSGCGTSGVDHTNGLELNAQSTDVTVYNNVISGLGTGTLTFWCATNAGVNCYGFNNVFYDTDVNNILDPAQSVTNNGCAHGVSYCNVAGNFFYYNNTVVCGAVGSPASVCQAGNSAITAITHQNNHYITSSTITSGTPVPTLTTNLLQTIGTANGQGYTAAQSPYVFFPTLGAGTIGTGTSLTSFCSTVNALDSTAGAACLLDTTYGVSIDRTAGTVTGSARTPVTRKSTPDIGAFEFAGGVTVTPSGSLGNGAIISGGAVIR